MNAEEAILLGLRALMKATEEERLNAKAVEIGIVRVGKDFRQLTVDEVESYIEKIEKE